MTTNCDLCLALKDVPVWVKVPNIFEGQLQPIIILSSEDNEQVIVPATSLLASSGELRRVIHHGNYLPLAYTATEVIIPGVTVDALKHVAEIVTTGKSDGVGRKVLQEVKEVLHVLQIVGEFEQSLSGEVEENVVENINMYGSAVNSKEGHVIEIKTEEFIIKLEFDGDDATDNHLNENLIEDETNLMQKSHASRLPSINTIQDKNNKAACKGSNEEAQEPELRRSKRKSQQIGNKKVNKVNEEIERKFRYGRNKNLRAHMLVHDNKYPSNLKLRKQAIQEGTKIYKCPLCEYITVWTGDFSRHKKAVHEGKTHACHLCEYRTGWPSNLRLHKQVVHEGKIHECPQCSFKSTWPSGLRQHMQSAHEEIVYSCESCNYESKVKEYLTKHKIGGCPWKQK